LQEFFRNAGNTEQFDTNVTVQDAVKKLGLPNSETAFKDMTIVLMPHQLIGVSWMLEKERNPAFKGGILADEMGLGKVIYFL